MDVDDVSYDIFEWFPILFCQNVFKYLSGKDVIEASAVNKEWNKLAGESAQAKKLKLVFNADYRSELTSETVKLLQHSKRKYQHIEFHQIEFKSDALAILADRKGSWKSVMIDNCTIDRENCFAALQIVEPTVEKLSIDYESGEPVRMKVDSIWTFPCLKSLECFGHYMINAFNAFNCCTSLLDFRGICSRYSYSPRLQLNLDVGALLRNNHGLTELSLLCPIAANVLNDPSGIKFRLRKLQLGGEVNGRRPARDCLPFLRLHAQTLESLHIHMNISSRCLKLIMRMPRLSHLKINIDGIDVRSFNSESLPINTTITDLHIRSEKPRLVVGLAKNFIKALPNLKHLNIPRIRDYMLLELSQHSSALESLKVHYFNLRHIPKGNIFPNIKVFETSYAPWLQAPTGDTKFAVLVREHIYGKYSENL